LRVRIQPLAVGEKKWQKEFRREVRSDQNFRFSKPSQLHIHKKSSKSVSKKNVKMCVWVSMQADAMAFGQMSIHQMTTGQIYNKLKTHNGSYISRAKHGCQE
jgi:hypothetical protein